MCVLSPAGGSASWSADQRPRRLADDPDRRLSRGVAARSAAARSDLCRVVARDPAHYRKGVRAEAARDFLAFIANHPPDENASEEVGAACARLYRALLPMRATITAELSAARPFPMPRQSRRCALSVVRAARYPRGHRHVARNTLGALMEERFEIYKREAVARFYEEHFRHSRRQIVLVDVLRALLAGRDAFEDARLALEAILQSFRYGPAACSPGCCVARTSTRCCSRRRRPITYRTCSATIWRSCCATWRRSRRST